MPNNTPPTTEHWISLENQYLCEVTPKQPLVLTRGKGARLWDTEGNEYIDCSAGHGVANVGHANPAVAEAIARQAEQLVTAPNDFYNDRRAELLGELVRIAPGNLSRAFLCNSGAEAVEGAIKFARLATGRTRIISTMRGFHGRTLGALSATWKKGYRNPFQPLVPGFEFVPYNRIEKMKEAVDAATAAVIVEAVQGEGGVNPGEANFLAGVQELCREQGALFIVDEVQTGFGRTGKMFASEHFNLDPDLMAVAKGIAGGVPMGAVLMGPRVCELPKKVHGTTFGGNALACAASLAAIKFIEEEKLVDRAREVGERFKAGLQAIDSPLIGEVRGLGLMIGVQLKDRAGSYLQKLAQPQAGLGVLALSAGSTVMRFLPPLVISEEDVDLVVDRVEMVLKESE